MSAYLQGHTDVGPAQVCGWGHGVVPDNQDLVQEGDALQPLQRLDQHRFSLVGQHHDWNRSQRQWSQDYYYSSLLYNNTNNRELIERFRNLKALYNLKKKTQCTNTHNYTIKSTQAYKTCLRKLTNIFTQNMPKTHTKTVRARTHTHTHKDTAEKYMGSGGKD